MSELKGQSGAEVIIRTVVAGDYQRTEITNSFNNVYGGWITIDLSNFDINTEYQFEDMLPFQFLRLTTQQKDTAEWGTINLFSMYPSSYLWDNNTKQLKISASTFNTNNTKSNYKLEFYAKSKGSVIVKGYSYGLSKEREELDVTTFGDKFKRTIMGQKKVDLELEAYEVQQFIWDSFDKDEVVEIEILAYADDPRPLHFKGFVSKIDEKAEINGVQTKAFKFTSA